MRYMPERKITTTERKKATQDWLTRGNMNQLKSRFPVPVISGHLHTIMEKQNTALRSEVSTKREPNETGECLLQRSIVNNFMCWRHDNCDLLLSLLLKRRNPVAQTLGWVGKAHHQRQMLRKPRIGLPRPRKNRKVLAIGRSGLNDASTLQLIEPCHE